MRTAAALVVEQEEDFRARLLAHADLDGVGHLEQLMQGAERAQPVNQIIVKRLVGNGADIDGLAQAEWCSW